MTRDKLIATIAKYLDAKPDEINFALKKAFEENIGSNGVYIIQEAIDEHNMDEYRAARGLLEYLMLGE